MEEAKPLYEIRNVVKGGIEMRGVFAVQKIQANTYLFSYAGDPEDCVKRTEFLNSLKEEGEARRHESYDMVHPSTPSLTLVPVDSEGKIKEKYINSPSIIVNEASEINEYPNIRYVGNKATGEINMITISDIEEGQELLGFYGTDYPRSWSLWWWENTTFLDRRKYFGGFMEHGDQLTTPDDQEVITVIGLAHIRPSRKAPPKRRRIPEPEEEERNVKEPKSEAAFGRPIDNEEIKVELKILKERRERLFFITERLNREKIRSQAEYPLQHASLDGNIRAAEDLFIQIEKDISRLSELLT